MIQGRGMGRHKRNTTLLEKLQQETAGPAGQGSSLRLRLINGKSLMQLPMKMSYGETAVNMLTCC